MKKAGVPNSSDLNKIKKQLVLERKKLDELVIQSLRSGGCISGDPAIMAQSHRVDGLLDAYDEAQARLEQKR